MGHSDICQDNIRLQLPETQEIARFTQAMELITYDRLLGENWSGNY